MEEDDLLAFGDFEIDTSIADARAARIAAARAQAKEYSAKIEEPGWFNDPKEAARLKDPSRAVLFSLHHLYFQKEWDKVVEGGLELYSGGLKEEGETMDLIMRAWQKAGDKSEVKEKEVVKIAKRWKEFPTQASICHISAQILHSAVESPANPPSSNLQREALSASLASLRLNRAQPPFLSTLQQILASSHPLLASALEDRSVVTVKREDMFQEVELLELNATERDTLEHVLGLHGEEKETEEDAGRDVRSL
ncbi:uncharacterized protein JCM6883_000251 [Sporobolomyces salmoneus]|uniref:uncharacterized protein n=1 Tax=Sporobolomyces salmoneus TaxID=183962 RepID=UPI00317CD3EF